MSKSTILHIDGFVAGHQFEGIGEPFIFRLYSDFPVIEHRVMGCFFHRKFLIGRLPVIFVPGHGEYSLYVISFGAHTQMNRRWIISIGPLISRHVVQSFQ
ncbi:hypothetical protein D3C77_404940 [compost metagenome]